MREASVNEEVYKRRSKQQADGYSLDNTKPRSHPKDSKADIQKYETLDLDRLLRCGDKSWVSGCFSMGIPLWSDQVVRDDVRPGACVQDTGDWLYYCRLHPGGEWDHIIWFSVQCDRVHC